MRHAIAKLLAWLGWTAPAAATPPLVVSNTLADITVSVEAHIEVPVETAVATPSTIAEARPQTTLIAVRLKSVSRVNKKARQRKYVAARKKKRTPDLYPMKRRAAVARKPELKVLRAKPTVRPSAMIIPFPVARLRKSKLKLAA